MTYRLIRSIPILRSFDEMKAKEFYVGFLGFKIDWEHRFEPRLPLYMQISRDELIVHLSEHHGDATPGSAVRIEVDDVDEMRSDLLAKKYEFARPSVHDKTWGSREMTIADPFGNRVTFYSWNTEAKG